MDTEVHPRPRRNRHDSSKHYDRERKDLELSEVLDVLQRYVDYGGGINCCVCGKLYKSRVCFIKHLWEHTVYWDLFAGDKNHMRVLSIQAALILYATCQQPLGAVPVDSLLVTSPHSTDSDARPPAPASPALTPRAAGAQSGSCPVSGAPALSACEATKLYPSTPVKQCSVPTIPSTPRKKVGKVSFRRPPPPRLDLKTPEKAAAPALVPQSPTHGYSSLGSPLLHSQDPVFRTPVKQGVGAGVPTAPRKYKKFSKSDSLQNRRVRRCLLPTTDVEDHQHWKDADSSACKRKRSE